MSNDGLGRSFAIGELAARTGLTPRVLRHWERVGVTTAERTAGGRRHYDSSQVVRLYQAMALRRAGLSLGRVATLLDLADPDPRATLRDHLADLDVDLERRGRLRDRLAVVLDRPDDPDLLTEVIAAMTTFDQYVHGYHPREGSRLLDQAQTLEDLLHRRPGDHPFPPGSRVLEVGCGVGAQTERLLRECPDIDLLAVDISAASLDAARARVGEAARFRQADVMRLLEALEGERFDHVFCCFVLEHLPHPVEALRQMRAVLAPGGTVTVLEGDHGSTFFHPDSAAARDAVACQVRLQADAGGDALIGRRLGPLLTSAGFGAVEVTPRQVFVDASRPALVEGFTRRTFTAMVAGVREPAIAAGLITAERFDEGIADLLRTAEPDGTFCYTFFRAAARA